jgi:hypothetical protein
VTNALETPQIREMKSPDSTTPLQRIPKIRMSMSQPPLIHLPQPSIPLAPIPLLILPVQIQNLRNRQNHRNHQRAQTHRMSQNILRRIVLQVDERAYECRTIRNRDHHADCDSAHVVGGYVIGYPCLLVH